MKTRIFKTVTNKYRKTAIFSMYKDTLKDGNVSIRNVTDYVFYKHGNVNPVSVRIERRRYIYPDCGIHSIVSDVEELNKQDEHIDDKKDAKRLYNSIKEAFKCIPDVDGNM